MAERKWLVYVVFIALSLTALGFTIAAERRRSIGTARTDEVTNQTHCVYSSDIATGFAVAAFLLLLASQTVIIGVTRCMCCGKPLAPGGNRACAIIFFLISEITHILALAFLIVGARRNTQHYTDISQPIISCQSLRRGIFIGAAFLILVNMIFNIFYYTCFTKAITKQRQATNSTSNIGMTNADYA